MALTPLQQRIAALCFGVLLFFSLYKLTESPSVWYDEGMYIQSASNLAEHGILGLQLAPGEFTTGSHITVGFPLLYPLALVFKIFGVGVFQARLLMVGFILALTIIGFLLVRRLFDTTSALWALALLSVFPPLYGNGKSVLGEVPGLAYLLSFLLSFGYAMRSSRLWPIILAGLFAALSAVTKPVFLLLFPALALTLFLKRQEMYPHWRRLSLAAAVGTVPMLMWLFTQFGSLDAFIRSLSFYANPYGISNVVGIVVRNTYQSFSNVSPLLLLLMVVVWIAALVLRMRRREPISFEETFAFSFVCLSILAYLRTEGWYRYLFPYQYVTLLFFPYALLQVVQRFQGMVPTMRIRIVPVILSVFIGVSLYQLCFNSWVANFYSSQKTSFWTSYFAELPANERVFYYDAPEVVLFDRGHTYYQYVSPAGWKSDPEVLSNIRDGSADVVIIRTELLKGRLPLLLPHYVVSREAYKYTILSKR